MKDAKISLWNNKWSDVYDFTAQKDSDDIHYSIKNNLVDCYIAPFESMKAMFDKVNKDREEPCNDIKELDQEELEELDKAGDK